MSALASKKILIIRLSSLGDILHALPALQSLRSTFPTARIDWLVEKRTRFLLSSVRGIDQIYTVDTASWRQDPWLAGHWREFLALIRTLKSNRYDLSLDFQGLLKTAFLSLFSGANTRMGFAKDLVRERPAHWFYHRTVARPIQQEHVVALNRLLAGAAGAIPDSSAVDLQVLPDDLQVVQSLLQAAQLNEFLVINPGGGWPTKRWRPSRYGALAARIQTELNLPVVVTTGPGEENLFEVISQNCGSTRPRHFQISFLQLIPLLRSARLLIAGDTGPFHLACALGTPVVGILGPTSPARNGPWSGLDEAVARVLPCSFCHRRSCPTQNECMDIPVDDVFEAVARRLGRTS